MEERALHTIQKHWRLSRARRAGEHTRDNSHRCSHLCQPHHACLPAMQGDTLILSPAWTNDLPEVPAKVGKALLD